jgi:NtrC-family two-component system response regulator AlgB
LVDDDNNICKTLALSLADMGCTADRAASVPEALRKIATGGYDLILTDYRMEGGTGLDLIQQVRRQSPEAILVLMTAFASYENAVAVIKAGAFDYLPKPFTTDQLQHLVEKVRELVKLKRENQAFRQARRRRHSFAGFTSPASQRLEEFVRKIAATEATVLLLGESGTGKSELARLIHELSSRSQGPFVVVQCTSLTESLLESELFGHVKGAFTGAAADAPGKLEMAEGGTLFLDEIGDISLSGQAKLLRFLQDKVFERVGGTKEISVNTRIIAATNRNLEEAVAHGQFREDLYYRLGVFECKLVPLRFRKEDLPVLIVRILEELAERSKQPQPEIPKAVMRTLLAYTWPGNIRQLRNVIERLVMLAGGRAVTENDLPESLLRPTVAALPGERLPTLEEVERNHIELVLSRESSLEKAAEVLGITTVTLWRKRKEYGLQ